MSVIKWPTKKLNSFLIWTFFLPKFFFNKVRPPYPPTRYQKIIVCLFLFFIFFCYFL